MLQRDVVDNYRSLAAWQVAHELALAVNRAADGFPRNERFEVTSQLRRAALSVPANLAEGQGRHGKREALRFTRIAAGSLAEVDYLMLFAYERGYLNTIQYEQLIALRKRAAALMTGLIRSLAS